METKQTQETPLYFTAKIDPKTREKLDDLAYVLGVKNDSDLIQSLLYLVEGQYEQNLKIARSAKQKYTFFYENGKLKGGSYVQS